MQQGTQEQRRQTFALARQGTFRHKQSLYEITQKVTHKWNVDYLLVVFLFIYLCCFNLLIALNQQQLKGIECLKSILISHKKNKQITKTKTNQLSCGITQKFLQYFACLQFEELEENETGLVWGVDWSKLEPNNSYQIVAIHFFRLFFRYNIDLRFQSTCMVIK